MRVRFHRGIEIHGILGNKNIFTSITENGLTTIDHVNRRVLKGRSRKQVIIDHTGIGWGIGDLPNGQKKIAREAVAQRQKAV